MSEEVMFYNHEQKERYFSVRETSYRKIRLVMKTFFNITKEYEEMLDKDCSNFTSNEILNMYSSCSTRSWEQLLNFNSQLKIYTAWCIKENLVQDCQNHYEEIDKNDMYSCLNLGLKESMVVTRKELENTLQHIPNVSDQFLVLAFFEGIGGVSYSDFYNLMPEQFKGNTLKLKNREIKVSTMLAERARESAEEYHKYNMEGPLRTGYRLEDPCVIKDSSNAFTNSEFRNFKRIQRRIRALETEYGKAFGYAGLKNSGRIDLLRRLMKEDNSENIRETYDKHKDEIENKYGKLQRIYRWIEENQQFFNKDSD